MKTGLVGWLVVGCGVLLSAPLCGQPNLTTQPGDNLVTWKSLGVGTNETGRLEVVDPEVGQHADRFYRAKER